VSLVAFYLGDRRGSVSGVASVHWRGSPASAARGYRTIIRGGIAPVTPRTLGTVAGERKGHEEVGRLGWETTNSRMSDVRRNVVFQSAVETEREKM
jgi:hypothetical protein